jgi:hypothetical protein
MMTHLAQTRRAGRREDAYPHRHAALHTVAKSSRPDQEMRALSQRYPRHLITVSSWSSQSCLLTRLILTHVRAPW